MDYHLDNSQECLINGKETTGWLGKDFYMPPHIGYLSLGVLGETGAEWDGDDWKVALLGDFSVIIFYNAGNINYAVGNR